MPPPRKDRKTRILDAAEKVFANVGFEGGSLRAIVQDAGVNLATVYYYFGSKEGLMTAVFNRRFAPLRAEHLALVKHFREEAKGQPIPVEKILLVMVLPALRLATTAPGKSLVAMRLIGRLVSEPNAQTQELLRSQFTDVREALLAAFRETLPGLPLPDLRWRIEFVWGALAFTLSNPHRIEKEADGLCNPRDVEALVAHMLTFFAPGFRAPPAMKSNPGWLPFLTGKPEALPTL